MPAPRRKPTAPDEASILRHLKKVDPHLHAAALPHKGNVISRVRPKRTSLALFQSLASSIVSQQLSTKAAETIYGRLVSLLGTVSPENVLAADAKALRSAGLSEAKVRSITELADAVHTKRINLLALKKMAPEEAVAELSKLRGIGPWTAEMFLIFALGAEDIFSPGDLALARSLEKLHGLERDTPRKELAVIAERWSPHRSYASLVLWKLYDPK